MNAITFAPRSALIEHFRAGYRLIPKHEYRPDDWAILLHKPEKVSRASPELIDAWMALLAAPKPRPVRSNISAARSSSHVTRKKLFWMRREAA